MQINKVNAQMNYSVEFNSEPSGLGATKATIQRILRSLDLVGWNTHEETGRLDRKAFTRYATGGTAIFSKRHHVEAQASAVTVLIDCSGSMSNGRRIQTAQSVAIQLSKMLDKANASFNVIGFQGGQGGLRQNPTGASNKTIDSLIEYTEFIPFKGWSESLTKASAKLGAIRYCANNSTPDYSALTMTLEDLSKRDEQRKILFFLTDADSYTMSHMIHVQNIADKLGIKIIAIGIGNTDVEQCFKIAQNVENVSDLADASFGKLLKELR
jgi:cobalamin biosynthesis protein CobT